MLYQYDLLLIYSFPFHTMLETCIHVCYLFLIIKVNVQSFQGCLLSLTIFGLVAMHHKMTLDFV